MARKLISLVLVLAMLLAMFPAPRIAIFVIESCLHFILCADEKTILALHHSPREKETLLDMNKMAENRTTAMLESMHEKRYNRTVFT